MKTPATLLASVLLGLGSASRSSGQIAVANPSFETPVVAQDDFTPTITGWTNPGSAGDTFIERVTGVAPADGGQYLGMELNASVHQDLGINYAANTVYRLRVALGNRPGFTSGGNLSTVTLTNPAGAATLSATRDASALAPGAFADAPVVIVDTAARPALVGTPIRIRLSAAGAGRSHFDRVRIDTPLVVSTTANSGAGSLRFAVANAASIPGPNTISFATSLNGQTITLASEIAVTDTSGVIIDATSLSGGLTISGNGATRIFSVNSGASLALRGLTLTRGYDLRSGGAIQNSGGDLTLTRCILSGNNADSGGAIFSETGSLTLTQSTLSGNTARGGGAIGSLGTLTLTNCTLSGNYAAADGAILSLGPAVITQSTISGNEANEGSGGIRADASLTLENSIVSGNTVSEGEPNIQGIITTSIGVNLTDGDPLLSPLGNYGGSTPTMPPLPGSPAIDMGGVAFIASDQRGAARVSGSGPDIGAVELGQTTVNTISDENNGLGNGDRSLREALTDTVPFGSELVRFDHALGGLTITLGAQIPIGKPLTHVDAASLPGGLTIAGSGADQIFSVNSGASLALRCLTLTGGNSGSSEIGGAIFSSGALALAQCTLSGNSAFLEGGAIFSSGPLTLTQCTLSGNSSVFAGGAISCSGPLRLTHCTISGNESYSDGTVIAGGQLILENSIVAGNASFIPSTDIAGTITFSIGVNITGGDPLLAPLGNYGGATRTMALLPGSPARNAATGSAITTDQRGLPIVGTPDIGAYEAGTPANYKAWIWESLPATATSAEHDQAFDFDGDGQGNEAEWAALTDPGNPDSRFGATVVRNGANLEITVPTVTGRTYTLLQSATLLDGSWGAVPGIAPQAGTGDPLVFPAPIGSGNLFFRAEVSLP